MDCNIEGKYEADQNEHAEEMKQWSDELSRILLGKTTFDIEVAGSKCRTTDDYSKTLLNSALFLKEETQNLRTLYLGGIITSLKKKEAGKPISEGDIFELDCCSLKVEEGEKAVTLTLKDDVASLLHYQKTYALKVRKANPSINNDMLNWVNQTLQEEMQDYLALKKRKTLPIHKLLIEAIKFFIEHTAPLVCYTGENERIRSEYHLQINVDDNNQLEVTACFSDWAKQETFSLEDYRERFRVWWTQMMVRECKYAKKCALDPEMNHPFDLPF